jgi:hypothetical protein
MACLFVAASSLSPCTLGFLSRFTCLKTCLPTVDMANRSMAQGGCRRNGQNRERRLPECVQLPRETVDPTFRTPDLTLGIFGAFHFDQI